MNGKAGGVTATDRLLADFCERSFLKLWSYPNPHKDDGHELCDLLAVIGDTVFIFFDRENALPEIRTRIRRSCGTAGNATSSIDRSGPRTGRSATSEAAGQSSSTRSARRRSRCRSTRTRRSSTRSSSPTGRSRPANGHRRRTFTAALRSRTRRPTEAPTRPFHIEIDRRDPLHVLDSHNMPIVLRELDTVTDFSVRGGFDEADVVE